MQNKWFKVDNSEFGLSKAVVFFDKIRFYVGVTDHWGIGISFCHYDRSLTLDILKWYAGVEVYHYNEL